MDNTISEQSYEEMLDIILIVLLSVRNSEDHTDNTGYDIEIIGKNADFDLGDGEIYTLRDILISDGHIEYLYPSAKKIVNITAHGTNFIRKGGYRQQSKEKSTKKRMDYVQVRLAKSNIETNNWSRFGIIATFILSILAMIISVIAILKK